MGKKHLGAIVTVVECKTLFTVTVLVSYKQPDVVTADMAKSLGITKSSLTGLILRFMLLIPIALGSGD